MNVAACLSSIAIVEFVEFNELARSGDALLREHSRKIGRWKFNLTFAT